MDTQQGHKTAITQAKGTAMETVGNELPQFLFPELGFWGVVKDGDPQAFAQAFALFKRHYSYRPCRDGRREWYGYRNRFQFVGPGEKMVLLSVCGDALFVWRKFLSDNGQQGVNCALFRNEGNVLSSRLIREAEALAWNRWPDQRLYTYVNPRSIRSTNPGFCFLCAGWQRCGITKWRRLLIFEKFPTGGQV
jgi:hypothetical protein